MTIELKDKPVLIRLHWYLAFIDRLFQDWQRLEYVNTRLYKTHQLATLSVNHNKQFSNNYSQVWKTKVSQLFVWLINNQETILCPDIHVTFAIL